MESTQNIVLSYTTHRGRDIVSVKYKYCKEFIRLIKEIPDAKWSQTNKFWYFDYIDFNLNTLLTTFRGVVYIDYSRLSEFGKPNTKNDKPKSVAKQIIKIPKSYKNLLDQRRYAKSTISTYIHYFSDFVVYFKDRDLTSITQDEINEYLLDLIREEEISSSQQNQRINAIKFYYEKVLGEEKFYFKIDRPRISKQLPNTLTISEIKTMIDNTDNIKHKSIISLIYSAGLRRSELINMDIDDILSDQMLIKIRNSKGNKDRYVGLSKYLLKLLDKYYEIYRPFTYLFEGQSGGRYSAESIVKIIKRSAQRSGIKRRVTPHMLRHSFATHHLESGTDLRYIQEFLGHGSPKTTEVYTHVAKTDFSKFTNPLDGMYKNENL